MVDRVFQDPVDERNLINNKPSGTFVTGKSMIHACQAVNTSDVARYHYILT